MEYGHFIRIFVAAIFALNIQFKFCNFECILIVESLLGPRRIIDMTILPPTLILKNNKN